MPALSGRCDGLTGDALSGAVDCTRCTSRSRWTSAFDSVGYDRREFVDVTHFYTNPMYVFSYVVSNDAAMQLYQLEQEQRGAGLELYEQNLTTEESYFLAFLDSAGLESLLRREESARSRQFLNRCWSNFNGICPWLSLWESCHRRRLRGHCGLFTLSSVLAQRERQGLCIFWRNGAYCMRGENAVKEDEKKPLSWKWPTPSRRSSSQGHMESRKEN